MKNKLAKKYQKNIKIKVIDYPLSFGGYLTKKKFFGINMLIKLYGYKSENSTYLITKIDSRNGKILSNYADQFYHIVEDAREIHNHQEIEIS